MMTPVDSINTDISLHEEIHGYRVENIVPLEEINAVVYRLTHRHTGARHVHISRQDKENTFGVVFKTVPTDSTGVAHILEHSVLCGSRKFPVRDPFFSMLKRSLSTFMNAFTSSDWTMYPFSTQNGKDYYNLMDVYLDAAFFPRLDELSFKQEGCRLEFESTGNNTTSQQLSYKGIVYNEMKGAMSSPDQVMGRSLLQALYPDTTYHHNSGGAPELIPTLTHAQLIAFHKRHYHPSNAYFYTYGELPLKGHLAFIAEQVMQHFGPIDPQTDVRPQPRWTSPRIERFTYPLGPSEDPTQKSQACLGWLTSDVTDTFEVLVLTVLEQILLGNAGSPLRKALMDSGLGSAMCDVTGFDADNRDTLFACGLKDIDETNAPRIEALILDTLQNLVKDKIEPELIRSAIHQIEFHRKEITNTPYPYGLKLLMMITGSWLHGGSPERILQLDADFNRLQAEIDRGPFLETAIRRCFLDNPHRVRMVLAPDVEKSRQEEARVRQELQKRQQELTTEEQERIIQDAGRLKQSQEAAEDMNCLPTLALTDIPREIQAYAPSHVSTQPALWTYTQPTSGIYYFSAAASAADLSQELLPWVPFFCYAFSKIGAGPYDYSQMARRIDAVTGGVGMTAQARVLYVQAGGCLPLLTLNSKCLGRNLDAMVGIIEVLIEAADFSNRPRLKQLLGEYVAGLESMIVQNGHRLAISLSARTFSEVSALSEIWGGIHQFQTLRAFNRELDAAKLETLSKNLLAIAQTLFRPDNLVMAAIGEQPADRQVWPAIGQSTILARFTHTTPSPDLGQLAYPHDGALPYEGWSTASAVAFVAQTIPSVGYTHTDAPALTVLGKILRSLYLHREIREKGGAYGGFALYNPENGLFSLASYRDPHIFSTLEVFSGVKSFIKAAALSEDDIKEAILQVCSEIDKPDPPGPAARKAFARLIVGLDDHARQVFKDNLLKVSRDQLVHVTSEYALGERDCSGVAVIAGQSHLETANQKLGPKPLVIRAI